MDIKDIDISTWVWLAGGALIFFNQFLNFLIAYFHDKAIKQPQKYNQTVEKLQLVKHYADLAVPYVANNKNIPKSESKAAASNQVVKSLKYAGIKGVSADTITNSVERAYQNYKAQGYDQHVSNNVVPEKELKNVLDNQKNNETEVKTAERIDESPEDYALKLSQVDPKILKQIADAIETQSKEAK